MLVTADAPEQVREVGRDRASLEFRKLDRGLRGIRAAADSITSEGDHSGVFVYCVPIRPGSEECAKPGLLWSACWKFRRVTPLKRGHMEVNEGR